MSLILLLLAPLLLILPPIYLLYTHSRKSLTPYTFFSYAFETQEADIDAADACVLVRSEAAEMETKTTGKRVSKSQESRIYMSLIVPAYNEQNRIEKMLRQTLAYCQKRHKQSASSQRPYTFEIIVVDDGSRDKTRDVVLNFISEHKLMHESVNTIRLLPLVQNRGKGFAVKQGVLRARGFRILMLDADGATEIDDMEKLEKALDEMREEELQSDKVAAALPPFNAALGSRRELESDADRHWFRDLISRVFNLLVRYISGIQEIKDTQCGFKMFERAAARYLFVNQHCERWCFDIDILILCQYHRQPRISIREVPIRWKEIAGSHLNIWGLLGILRDLFLIRLYYVTGLWSVTGAYGAKEYEKERGELWIPKYEKVIGGVLGEGKAGDSKKRQ